MEKTQEFNSA